jgi:hypothetical protein
MIQHCSGHVFIHVDANQLDIGVVLHEFLHGIQTGVDIRIRKKDIDGQIRVVQGERLDGASLSITQRTVARGFYEKGLTKRRFPITDGVNFQFRLCAWQSAI